jgi:spoIIIJ-associated protein
MISLLKYLTKTEKEAKSVDEAKALALQELGIDENEAEIEVIDEGTKGFLGIGSKGARVKATAKDGNAAVAKHFLNDIFGAMGLDVAVSASSGDESLDVFMEGSRMGLVIGKHGDTLDALQYLTSLVVNKGEEDYIRVTIDTENYRGKREETLIKLAKRMAGVVSRTRKSVTLEPMNPNERRIIHSALQEYRNVTTYSTGKDPNRCIVITTKKKEYGDDYVSKYRYNRKENELKTE